MDGASLVRRRKQLLQAGKKPEPVASPTAQSPLSRAKALASKGLAGADSVSDLERILALPLNFPLDEGEREAFNQFYLLKDAYQAGRRFLPAQPNGIIQYANYAGAFLPIGVGHGKTLICLTIADIAYKKGQKIIVYFLPSNVAPQLIQRDLKFARQLVPISYPIHFLYGMPQKRRIQTCKARMPGVYIFPYSLVSRQDSEDNLLHLRPDTIIADEAHSIANAESARTKRLIRVMKEIGQDTEWVATSGTITAKSLKDYEHLALWSLKKNCFLPLNAHERYEWREAMDAETVNPWAGSSAQRASKSRAMTRLVKWANQVVGKPLEYTTTGFRKAFSVRLNTCPGVFVTADQSASCSLTIHNEPIKNYESHPDWPKLEDLIAQVETQWKTPSGDEIEHQLHTYKWLYELSAGFYNNLVWPSPGVLAKRREVSEYDAERLLERAKEWHEAGQDYAVDLRKFLKNAPKGIDTPFLVGSDMHSHQDQNVPTDLYNKWRVFKSLDFEGRPDRDSFPVKVCDYKVQKAVAWAKERHKKNLGGIIWTHNTFMGIWVHQELTRMGFPSLHCPAGKASDVAIIDPDNDRKIIVASISAHGTGKNLQHFQHQLFLQWPRQAKTAEQVLGRLHRNGQKADELVVDLCLTLTFDHMLFASCLNDALYIHQTLGSPQRLVTCNYDPRPRIFPEQVLEERGFDPTHLDPETIRARAELFE